MVVPLLAFGLAPERVQPVVPELLQERPDGDESLRPGAVQTLGSVA
jgi:hypothetical protein